MKNFIRFLAIIAFCATSSIAANACWIGNLPPNFTVNISANVVVLQWANAQALVGSSSGFYNTCATHNSTSPANWLNNGTFQVYFQTSSANYSSIYSAALFAKSNGNRLSFQVFDQALDPNYGWNPITYMIQ